MIMMGWGIQRIQYGEQPHWMAFTLASVLGPNRFARRRRGHELPLFFRRLPFPCRPDDRRFGASSRTGSSQIKTLERKRLYPGYAVCGLFSEPLERRSNIIGKRLTYPDIRMVMWTGGNPFAHQPETNRLLSAWKKPETIVVTDCFMTATARHADLVLSGANRVRTQRHLPDRNLYE